ncbi:outer membrane beta-barrel protein [Sphingobacterium bambusae]|uniref:Outer membrane beta-barrel protein n=1 Tax=Sphingobacterium bambusae TaxID=662858 RepID=A0ABW6BJ11_9SPHI|nr:outer membrane beta-barrel protein [Sphingobacterium bambusae]WPL49401.1 outer membrane beta-barrel protein [Sphingobacterium bambusae]
MYKFLLSLICIFSIFQTNAQQRALYLGLTGEVQMEAPSYPGFIGVQAKYDFTWQHNVQATFGLNSDNSSYIGADYLFNFLEFGDRFNLYAGAGLGLEFYRKTFDTEMPNVTVKVEDTFQQANVQFGVNADIWKGLSMYLGYKTRYYIDHDSLDPNYVSVGIRCKLWN